MSAEDEAEEAELDFTLCKDSHVVPVEEWIKAEFRDMEAHDINYLLIFFKLIVEAGFCNDEFRTDHALSMDAKFFEFSLWCF